MMHSVLVKSEMNIKQKTMIVLKSLFPDCVAAYELRKERYELKKDLLKLKEENGSKK